MKIDDYLFGKMVINGQSYTSDLIIYPTRVDSTWWREESHRLQIRDSLEILREKPEILIIGTGYHGGMQVPDEFREQIMREGINLMVGKTAQAVKLYNSLMDIQSAIAAFHLTC